MKKFPSVFTLFLIGCAVYGIFASLTPSYKEGAPVEATDFSTDKALKHVKAISKAPHAVGFPGHGQVRDYIVDELEKLGLETSLQTGYTAGDWGNLSKAVNVLARIKGTGNGKALVLLSHYDSSPHSSLGASDAGSGVATILEGVRAFLSKNPSPKNDVIILITDAEELGLNGADIFANEHPWAKEVGLVLNFEARGSGGPSYMLIETNRGNARLIEEFKKARPDFPVANSLVYSIYKMLPNDTDLTVFREDQDIEGFNFAFIDDHYDYHTVRDNYARLDRRTLAHQGSYIMPLLSHFANADLSSLKSLNDHVYFNVPFFKLVSYPFEWIWPMLLLSAIAFVLFMAHGFLKKKLDTVSILKGFLPMLLVLLVNGGVGFYSYTLLQWLYPSYTDMLHGFTYNGHFYIAAFVLFSISVCCYCYHRFKRISLPNVLVAPIILWLAICTLVALYLPGASFFIVPVMAMLAGFMVVINQKRPSAYLLLFLVLPALALYAPFIKMFPVGLGLKMMVASTLLLTLTFLLMLPLVGFMKRKNGIALLAILAACGFLIAAHLQSDFTEERAKPSSLLYVLDADSQEAYWATYDHVLIDWNAQFLRNEEKTRDAGFKRTISSKYGSGFKRRSKAALKEIPAPEVATVSDTIVGEQRFLTLCIRPQRTINRLEVFTNDIDIYSAGVNGIALSDYFLENRRNQRLITHYVSDNSDTELLVSVPKNDILELTLYEASNDLLTNPLFSIPQRPENSIPMPFVLNDAVLVTKTVRFE